VEDAILVGTREWGIVLDAGSSGTRALLYSWDSASPLDSVRQLWIKKQRPGLSSCAKPTIGVTMRECAERKILGLLETVGHSEEWAVVAAAAERRAAQAQTHVILRATAGLRLLTNSSRTSSSRARRARLTLRLSRTATSAARALHSRRALRKRSSIGSQ
jgi:Golgi nucleoside diphosphatase